MDSGRKDGFCPFCGTKYVTEEIIHKTVVNQNITNRIETAVIQNGDSFDMLYERFAAFEEIGDLQSMTEIVGQMQKTYPQRAATWLCSAIGTALRCKADYADKNDRIGRMAEEMRLPDPVKVDVFKKASKIFGAAAEKKDAQYLLENIPRHESNDPQVPVRTAAVYRDSLAPIREDIARAEKFEEETGAYASLMSRAKEELSACERSAGELCEKAEEVSREMRRVCDCWTIAAKKAISGGTWGVVKKVAVVVVGLGILAFIICFVVSAVTTL